MNSSRWKQSKNEKKKQQTNSNNNDHKNHLISTKIYTLYYPHNQWTKSNTMPQFRIKTISIENDIWKRREKTKLTSKSRRNAKQNNGTEKEKEKKIPIGVCVCVVPNDFIIKI